LGPEQFPGGDFVVSANLQVYPKGRLQHMVDVLAHQKGCNAGRLEQSAGELGFEGTLETSHGDKIFGRKGFGTGLREHERPI